MADFVAAVKTGRLAQGFIAAVESCGDILETHYPETHYPETHYPETHYPETHYPETAANAIREPSD